MTTLIQVGNSQGIVGRCDAKCYDAQHPRCDCVCGGKNHGVGRQTAIENTREYAEHWIANYVEEKDLSDYEVLLGVNVIQQGMFE